MKGSAAAGVTEQEACPVPDDWDPDFVQGIVPLLDVAMAYFDAEIEGFEHVPYNGPVLIVGNHSGGIYMPDYWVLLRHWIRERGNDVPLYSLGFDFLFSLPGVRSMVRRIGSVPACHANGERLLRAGNSVIVYPGGDADDYRPWTERHRIDLHGRTGFVRLALRTGVPVVPVVAHGSHDVLVVLTRGEALARHLGLDRLRIKVLPLVAGPPFGVMPVVPMAPLPAKVTVRVCEPLDWSAFVPDGADDPAVIRHCYEEILGRMQWNLDELVAARPHPLLARALDPLRSGSRRRGSRP